MKQDQGFYNEEKLPMVGGTEFGRYEKISSESTYNMIISDNWLVPFAGYQQVLELDPTGQGRGIYASGRYNIMLVVVDDNVWVISTNINKTFGGNIGTFTGDVYIASNNRGQFAISDQNKIYIYDIATNTTVASDALFRPGHLSFQNDRFICADLDSNKWRLSKIGDGLFWPGDAQHVSAIRTKPDKAQITVPIPGRGNTLLVMGKSVGELWTDIGAQLFPYQRSTSANLDFGCVNPSSFAESTNIIAWLSSNDKSGYSIMMSDGGTPQKISNDGIDFKLSQLQNPADSYAMFFRQDGHLIFMLTFVTDNITWCYDFNTKKFFSLSDENLNYFIAKRVVFFNNTYYFVSLIDGNLYELSTQYTEYDGKVAPRIRITPNFRLPDQSRFTVGYAGFTTESGITDDIQAVELSLSKDGGASFGSVVRKDLKTLGKRQNRLLFWRLGMANDLVLQWRFYGKSRFLATDGVIGVKPA